MTASYTADVPTLRTDWMLLDISPEPEVEVTTMTFRRSIFQREDSFSQVGDGNGVRHVRLLIIDVVESIDQRTADFLNLRARMVSGMPATGSTDPVAMANELHSYSTDAGHRTFNSLCSCMLRRSCGCASTSSWHSARFTGSISYRRFRGWRKTGVSAKRSAQARASCIEGQPSPDPSPGTITLISFACWRLSSR